MASIESYCYFILGVVFTLFVMIILRDINKKKSKKNGNEGPAKFYLNCFVLNSSDLVKEKVREKVAGRPIAMLGGVIGRIASSVISDELITKKVAARLADAIPERLVQMGITSTVKVVYTQASYLCLEIAVLNTEARKLLENIRGKEKGDRFASLMDLIGMPSLERSFEASLAVIVGEKLKEKLPQILAERAQEKAGLELESVACSSGDQVSILFYCILL